MKFMPLPIRCLSIFGLSLTLSACDTPPTLVDHHFGMAVQRAQAQQSQHSPVRQSAAPVPDTDGISALGTVTRYQQSFQTPTGPAPVFNIGLGAVATP